MLKKVRLNANTQMVQNSPRQVSPVQIKDVQTMTLFNNSGDVSIVEVATPYNGMMNSLHLQNVDILVNGIAFSYTDRVLSFFGNGLYSAINEYICFINRACNLNKGDISPDYYAIPGNNYSSNLKIEFSRKVYSIIASNKDRVEITRSIITLFEIYASVVYEFYRNSQMPAIYICSEDYAEVRDKITSSFTPNVLKDKIFEIWSDITRQSVSDIVSEILLLRSEYHGN